MDSPTGPLRTMLEGARSGVNPDLAQFHTAALSGRAAVGMTAQPTSAGSPSQHEPAVTEATAEVIEAEIRSISLAESAQRLKGWGRRSLMVGWGGSAVLAAAGGYAVLATAARSNGLGADPWWLLVLAALALAIVLAICFLLGRLAPAGGISQLLVGADGRLSTSTFQGWLWTLVLAWAFVFFGLQVALLRASPAHLLPAGAPLDANYLLLMGGPFAALVTAKGITAAKVAGGTLQKAPATGASPADLVTDDRGRVDFIDTQYLVFNLVAVVVFFALLVADPTALPRLPNELVILTSASALTYIGGKAVTRSAPVITAVLPAAAARAGGGHLVQGTPVVLRGSGFTPNGADDPLRRVTVAFGTVQVAVAPPQDAIAGATPATQTLSDTAITVTMPAGVVTGAGPEVVQVTVTTLAGATSAAFPVQVYAS